MSLLSFRVSEKEFISVKVEQGIWWDWELIVSLENAGCATRSHANDKASYFKEKQSLKDLLKVFQGHLEHKKAVEKGVPDASASEAHSLLFTSAQGF